MPAPMAAHARNTNTTIGQRELDATSGERNAELRRTLDLSLAALDDLRQSLAVGGAARAG